MRKYSVYAFVLVFLFLLLWFGYYFYLENRPLEYQNGTFVELPVNMGEERKLPA